jgi:signal transduction histidine kinase
MKHYLLRSAAIGQDVNADRGTRATAEAAVTARNGSDPGGDSAHVGGSAPQAGQRRARRLALDLHDGPLQTAALLDGELKALSADWPVLTQERNATEIVAGRLADLGAMMSRLQDELRAIVAASESPRTSIDLYASLEDLAQTFRRHTDGTLELSVERGLDDLTDSQQIALFHIAQEALSNALAHAGATSIRLTIRRADAGVEVEVVDDGGGFDPARRPAGHTGLMSMQERAEMLGGRCRIESDPGRGTRIAAWLPAGGWREAP